MEARRPEQSQTLVTLRKNDTLHLVLRMRAHTCVQLLPARPAAKIATPKENVSAVAAPAEKTVTEVCATVSSLANTETNGSCHNIGATLILCSKIILSWLNSDSKAKEFRILLPGTKTVMAYNPHEHTLTISDEMMETHYNPAVDHPRSHLPNATDPRIASMLFMLLEETYNVKDHSVCDAIKSFEFHHTEMKYRAEQEQALVSELTAAGILNRNSCAENFFPKRHLFAIKVTGNLDIIRLACSFEHAFKRHKGRVIPVEPGAEKTLRHTL